MTQYGRHVNVRTNPDPQDRKGRYKTGATPILQWTPVTSIGQTQDEADLRTPMVQAGEALTVKKGVVGLVCWDEGYHNYDGVDPVLARPNDVVNMVPALTPAQLVVGGKVRVEYRNWADDLFDGQREYEGGFMYKPADCATAAVGDLVTAGAGNLTDGYFKKTTDATKSLGVIDEVNFDDDDLGFVVIHFDL